MKTAITLLTSLSVTLAATPVRAQAPAIEWKNVCTSYIGYGSCIAQTSDGGYIAGGSYASHFLAFKLDASGSQQWGKYIFSGTGVAGVSAIRQTSDGGYIAAGSDFTGGTDSIGNHGIRDFMVTKLSRSGTPQWIKCLGGTSSEEATSIEQTSDGGYIVAGYTGSNDMQVSGLHGSVDYWVVKLDASGSISWQKALGGSNFDYATSVMQTADGGYIVAGYSGSKDGNVTGTHWGSSDNDVWIVKLDATGNISWQKSYGGSKDDQANAIRQTSDGGYIIAGTTTSNDGNVSGKHGTSYDNNDYWVIRIDNSGSLLWQKCLGGAGSGSGAGSGNDIAYAVQQTSDGGYMVAGTVSSGTASNDDITGYHGATGSDYWIVKLSSAGAITWQKCLGGNGTEDLRAASQTSDGGYILAGTTLYSPDGDVATTAYGDNHPWVVKLKGDGSGVGIQESDATGSFRICPNPANDLVSLSGVPEGAALSLSDLKGQLLYSKTKSFQTEEIITSDLANGIYFIRIENGTRISHHKLIVNH